MIVSVTARFRVVSNKVGVTALEWDLPGDKLLVADTAGNVQLWSFKDHLLTYSDPLIHSFIQYSV
jgi:hypothetical protein